MPEAASHPSPSAVRTVFMGSPEFAVPSLRRLLAEGYDVVGVYTQPDREAGRGRELRPSPVKRAAMEAGLPTFQPSSLRQAEAVEQLAALQPGLIVVVAFGKILLSSVLRIPAHGVINVHASLLPRYRGASPVMAALLNGEEVTGVSIMLLDEGLDTGPLLAQRAEMILPEDTAATVSDRLANLGAELLVETMPAWLTGGIMPAPQDESRASMTRRVRKEDGRLDWSLPAQELWRRIRAYTPWPGATTTLHGGQLQILQAWPVPGRRLGEAGEVVEFHEPVEIPAALPAPALGVQTGDGLLLPLILRRAGRKALSAREFRNGERGLIGARLGA